VTLTQLPALQILAPLMSAPLCVLFGRAGFAWVLAVLASWGAFGVSVLLLGQVMASGPISYALGGWAAPWGIEYRVDPLNALMLLMVSGIGAVVVSGARASVEAEVAHSRQVLFYATYLLSLAGLLGVTITGDAFNLFVFLEIASLSAYVLVSLGRDRRALTAAFQYLVMGTIGATFIVIGIGLLYMTTGTLNMVDLAHRLPTIPESRTALVGFTFLTVGASLKLALFPLHLWLPNAYTFAPSVVSAFLAATATKVSAYMLLRFFFTVFHGSLAQVDRTLDLVMVPLGIAGILVGSVVAIFQTDAKRMFAYSSVAQIGYVVLGIGISSVTGLTGAIAHLFNHALMKGTLFLALAGVALRVGSVELADLRGLGRRMPVTAAALLIGGLSLVGVPGTAGFTSKWYLVLGALERGWWGLAVLLLLGSLLTLVYVWRLAEALYLSAGAGDAPREAPRPLLAAVIALALANLYFGLQTDLSVGVAGAAARSLLEAPP
jgi:multicomponent Na+:H+ antiporter subunit D